MADAPLHDHAADQRRRLEDLRDRLEDALRSCSENMLPQLAGQYRATLDDLAKLGNPNPVASVQDELKKRREHRRKKSA